MTGGLVAMAPVSPDHLTDDQIRAFRDSLPYYYVDERQACNDALESPRIVGGWRDTRRRWIAYRINRLAGLVVLAIALLCARTAAADCGEERASIKLGLDEEAKRIDTEAVDTTIASLVNLPRPGKMPEDRRASSVERTVWRVEATVIAYKVEQDQDFHLVISDGARTMIVEIPSPECAAPGAWGPEIKAARESFLRILSDRGFPAPAAKLHRINIPVSAAGVGFFDKIHGQTGVSRTNGIELHPLISIDPAWSSSRAAPAQTVFPRTGAQRSSRRER